MKKMRNSLFLILGLSLVFTSVPIEPVAAQQSSGTYNGNFGMANVNQGDSPKGFRTGTNGTGTIHNSALATQRALKAKSLGSTWARVDLPWVDIERYGMYLSTIPEGGLSNAYGSEGEAVEGGAYRDDLVVSDVTYGGMPAGSFYYRAWEWENDTQICTYNEALSTSVQKSPMETTWTWGANDNEISPTGVQISDITDSTRGTGYRQYSDIINTNFANGLNNLVILQTAPRCRSIPGSSNIPSGLDEGMFLDSNGQPTNTVPSNWSISNLNPLNPWAFYVYKAVDKYKDKVGAWQVWNEENGLEFGVIPSPSISDDPEGNAKEMARLFGRMAEISKVIINKLDPSAEIVMGGIVHDSGTDNWYTNDCHNNPSQSACNSRTRWFLERLASEASGETSAIFGGAYKNLFTKYGLHRYCGPWATIAYLNWMQNAMGYTEKEYWLTETGGVDEYCGSDYTANNSAQYVPQHIAYLLAYKTQFKIDKFFQFQMTDLFSDDLSIEREMGKSFIKTHQYLSEATFSDIEVQPDPMARTDFEYLSGNTFAQRTESYQRVSFTHPLYERVSVVWDLHQESGGSNSINRAINGRQVKFENYQGTAKQFQINVNGNDVSYGLNLIGRGSNRALDHAESTFMIESSGCNGQTLPTGDFCAQFYKNKNLQDPVIWEQVIIGANNALASWWTSGQSPIPNVTNLNVDYSIVFLGNVDLTQNAYDFFIQRDDGFQIFANGQLIDFGSNTWGDSSYSNTPTQSVTPYYTPNPSQPTLIEIRYYQAGGQSRFNASWVMNATACLPGGDGGVALMAFEGGEENFETMDVGFCPRLPFTNEFQVNYYNNVTNGAIDFSNRIPTYTTFLDTNTSQFDKIDYNWGTARPVPDTTRPNLINANNYAVRFWGDFEFLTGGDYIFKTTSDDGIIVRMKLDIGGGQIIDVPIITDWTPHSPRQGSKVISIPPGTHRVIVEYFENTGSAQIKVGWEPAANTVCQRPTDGTFCARYYNNINMEGAPVFNQIETLTRTEHPNIGVEYNWGTGGPGNGVAVNNFSAIWEGYINFDTTDAYRFITNSDDGIKLFVDNSLVIDDWEVHVARVKSAYTQLTAGLHLIRVEYYEAGGNAQMQFYWESMSYLDNEDYECLTPTNAYCTKFYNTANLDANPRIVPNYATILQPSTFTEVGRSGLKNSWGATSPMEGRVNPNGFTAVFEGRFTFTDPGDYEFTSQSDDGMKIFVNGTLVVDNWGNHTLKTVSDTRFVTPGTHTIRVQYYDNTGTATANFWWQKVGDYPGGTTYPYGIIRADTDPVQILGNQSYSAIKNISALFDGVYTWPNNAVVHYVNAPVSVIMEFETPVSLSGFKFASVAERWDIYKANSWEDMESGNYTVVGTGFTGTPANGYVDINFSSQTAKVFKVRFTRTSGDRIVHILDIVPKFATTSGYTGPSMSPIPNQVIRANERWIYRPQVYDPNDGPSFLYFNLGSNPQGLYYASTANTQGLGWLEWLPSYNDIGTHQIFVTVRDTEGNTATRSFFLTVIP